MTNFKPVLTKRDDFEITDEYMSVWTDDIRVTFYYTNDIISIIDRKTGWIEDVPYSKIRSFTNLLHNVKAKVINMRNDIFEADRADAICDLLANYEQDIVTHVNAMGIAYIDLAGKIKVQHKELRLMKLCPVYKFGQLEYEDCDCENCWHADSEGYCHEIYDDWIQLESEHHITCRGIWNNYTDNTTKYAKFWLLEDDKEFFDDELGVDVVDFDEIIADMMDLDVNTVVKIDGIDDCTANTVEWLSLYLKDRIKVLKW